VAYVYTGNQPLFSSEPGHLSYYQALDYNLCTKGPEPFQLGDSGQREILFPSEPQSR